MTSSRTLPALPALPALLGLALLAASASGCTSVYRLEAAADFERSRQDRSAASPSVTESSGQEAAVHLLGAKRVLLVVPAGEAQAWAPGSHRYTALQSALVRAQAELGPVVEASLAPAERQSQAEQAACLAILSLERFEWRGTSLRWFAATSKEHDILGEVSQGMYDALGNDHPRWKLEIPSQGRLRALGDLRINGSGGWARALSLDVEVSLAFRPYPGPYGAVIEWLGQDRTTIRNESPVEQTFGDAARAEVETRLLREILERTLRS